MFVSGQIPVTPGGVAPPRSSALRCKTRRVSPLRNIQTILRAAGSSLDRVVKVTVLLARPDLYKEMNEAYAEFFPGAKPAQSMIRFGADIPGVLVAVDAIAFPCRRQLIQVLIKRRRLGFAPFAPVRASVR